MPASPAFAHRLGLIAALLLAATPALVQAASAQTTDTVPRTPTQPTANDPSVGLPEEPASMSKNPVAATPDVARKEGTAPASPDAAKK